jgi:hypothetical protein
MAASPKNLKIFWMVQKNFTGKGDVKHKLKTRNCRSKSGARSIVGISKGNSTSKSVGRSTQPSFMGEQPQPECKIGELCTPNIVDLPILNLVVIRRPFEIKTSTILVQHSLFIGKEDPNLHLQAFIQLCQTLNMDGVTQNKMRAKLFLF